MDKNDNNIKEYFIYSDESGVLSKTKDIFITSFVIFKNREYKSKAKALFEKKEKKIKKIKKMSNEEELKGFKLPISLKKDLFRTFKDADMFCAEIDIKRVNDDVMSSKANRRRYINWTICIALKRYFALEIKEGNLTKNDKIKIYLNLDNVSTKTSGHYTLYESIIRELFLPVWPNNYKKPIPALFNNIGEIQLKYLNSCHSTFIRMADILANIVFVHKKNEIENKLEMKKFLFPF
ncbi:hypothetical protein GE118_03620 [Mycoplasma sp. NEAQ87857]|uniref:DUF3800 domain-containing protein n=1 Tax=Mycoplasma sp. NEAQ87857 TaxID=2683967 RepID=UPI001315F576|nr:DUF3800 domain-containing protein [Mycoplasma sp. NEAQ87857]QGZ97236.1 hypothetical protein GE118_00260 [Mycoplasma sp. NEAQ87857]QGZ97871.1 hypothetical protein GE118_03620 [Mycoplasma sp. NEAQ87857]